MDDRPVGIVPAWFRWCAQIPALALLCVSVPYLASLLRPPLEKSILDFFQEWASARNYWEGLPIYTRQDLSAERYLGHVMAPGETLAIRYNAHPPVTTLLALPLGRLDYRNALLVWNLLSWACVAGSIFLILRTWRLSLPKWLILPALAGALLFGPLVQQMELGQLHAALLLLLTAVWVFDRSDRQAAAGAALGLAIAMKFFPGFLLAYLLFRRRWTAVVWACGTAATWLALSWAVLGADAWSDYFKLALPETGTFRSSWVNVSANGFWSRLLASSEQERVHALFEAPALASALAAASGLLLALAVARAAGRARMVADADAAFGLALTGMALASPISWEHNLLMLVPALIGFARATVRHGGSWLGPLTIVLCLGMPSWRVLLLQAIAAGQLPPTLGPVHSVLLCSIPFYVLVAFFILQARRIPDAAATA